MEIWEDFLKEKGIDFDTDESLNQIKNYFKSSINKLLNNELHV